MTDHLEVELKLAISPADLDALRAHPLVQAASIEPPVREPIGNRYYDTPDRLLATRGMALRLRRIGKQWLQTLKTAGRETGAMSTRNEWEMPVAGPRLELARLAQTPLAQIGDAATLARLLVPRYSTDFTRERRTLAFADGTRAEFAIDVGEIRCGDGPHARTAPICELEIELERGEPRTLLDFVQRLARDVALVPCFDSKAARGDALADAKTRAPVKMATVPMAADMPMGVALADVLTAGLRCVIANLPGAIDVDADPEFVHQARVALRRMRSLLHTHAMLLNHRASTHALDRALRALAITLGEARDWDVFCTSTLALLAQPAPGTGRDAVRAAIVPMLRPLAHAQREAAHDAVWHAVIAREFGTAMLKLEAYAMRLREHPGPDCAHAARAVLEAQHAKTVARAHKLATEDERGMHRLRIEVKRLRYAFDLYAPLFDAAAAHDYIGALVALQERLGKLNDIAVALRLLARLGKTASPERLWQPQMQLTLDQQRPKIATHVMELRAAARVWTDGAPRS